MRFFYFVILFLVPIAVLASNPIKDETFKGKKLIGKVRVVERNADFKVQIVDHYNPCDLKVQVLPSYQHPNQVGQWQMVESGENFTIQFVNSGADFTIRFVTSNPGVH